MSRIRDGEPGRTASNTAERAGTAISPPDDGAMSWLNRVTIAAGGTTAMLGLVVLVGWHTRSTTLIQVNPAFVPMQYNAALGFLLSGLALLSLVSGWAKPAAVLGAAVAAIGSLTLIEYGFGIDLGIDQLFIESYINVKTSHPGRMAPNTALNFLLSGAALCFAGVAVSKQLRFLVIAPLCWLVLGLGLITFVGYLIGVEEAYSWGNLTDMAIHTGVGFVVLGSGILTFEWRARLKLSLFRAQHPLQTDEHTLNGRKRIVALVSVMATVSIIVAGVAMLILYDAAFREAEHRLLESARSHARLIEAVAQFDRSNNPGDFEKAAQATLSQIKQGLAPIQGTIEITVGRRIGEYIEFLLRQRASQQFDRAPVDFLSPTAEPMRRALMGFSGIVVGPDYRNEMVLAAHEPVAVLDYGIVVKIDLAEVRAPFIRAGLIVTAIALAVILFATTLFLRISEPMIRQLQKSERNFRNLFDNAEVSIWNEDFSAIYEALNQLRRDGVSDLRQYLEANKDVALSMVAMVKVIQVNQATLELYGATTENTFIESIDKVFGPDALDVFIDELCAIWKKEKTFRAEAVQSTLDGKELSVVISMPIPETMEGFRSVPVSILDITERKQAQDELQQSETRNRQILDSAGEGIYGLDEEGMGTFVNPAAARMVGWASEELIGKSQHEILHHSRSDGSPYPREECLIYAAITDGKVHTVVDDVFWHKDGSSFPVEYTSTPVFESGKPVGAVVVFRDITERKQAADDLKKLNEELETRVLQRTAELSAANAELESFAYSVSHDLRAPLRGLDGFSRILLKDYGGSLDDKTRHYLDRIRAASRKMAQLIDDILKLSRSTRSELKRQNLDLSEMARAICEQFANTEPGRRVTVDIAEGLEAEGDPTLVAEVLDNLLGNAWKFTAKTDRPEIAFGEEIHDGRKMFFIQDNGAGFDMAFTDKLFAPFQRLHSTEDFEGTGIGLSIVNGIIHRHGGEVWAEAEVGKGATIYFSFSR